MRKKSQDEPFFLGKATGCTVAFFMLLSLYYQRFSHFLWQYNYTISICHSLVFTHIISSAFSFLPHKKRPYLMLFHSLHISRSSLTYRIPVQLSSARCLFPDPTCVPDSGTTFFWSLPVPGSSLRTGFRYNFLLVAAHSRLLPDVPDSGTTFFRSLPIPSSSLRTEFRYNFLPIAACSQFLSAYRIPVQLFQSLPLPISIH